MRLDMLNDLYKSENRFFDDWRKTISKEELEVSGEMNKALSEILNGRILEEDENIFMPYTERLAAAAKGAVDSMFNQVSINTYPFGTPTKDVFSEFLGICVGETKLQQALEAVRRYCENTKKLPSQDEKTVVLLTDKWDGTIFREKFELGFLHYALENNILFIFLLVTDYGIIRIPFFARNRADLNELQERNYYIEKEYTGVTALNILKQSAPCTYERHSGTWAIGNNEFYSFDFNTMRCEIESAGKIQIKKIPKSAALKFAAVFYEFLKQPDKANVDSTLVLDAGYCRAKVFDVCFEWYDFGTEHLQQPYKKVSIAFNNLIYSLKEVKSYAKPN